jgi:hypothetical protein
LGGGDAQPELSGTTISIVTAMAPWSEREADLVFNTNGSWPDNLRTQLFA